MLALPATRKEIQNPAEENNWAVKKSDRLVKALLLIQLVGGIAIGILTSSACSAALASISDGNSR